MLLKPSSSALQSSQPQTLLLTIESSSILLLGLKKSGLTAWRLTTSTRTAKTYLWLSHSSLLHCLQRWWMLQPLRHQHPASKKQHGINRSGRASYSLPQAISHPLILSQRWLHRLMVVETEVKLTKTMDTAITANSWRNFSSWLSVSMIRRRWVTSHLYHTQRTMLQSIMSIWWTCLRLHTSFWKKCRVMVKTSLRPIAKRQICWINASR